MRQFYVCMFSNKAVWEVPGLSFKEIPICDSLHIYVIQWRRL